MKSSNKKNIIVTKSFFTKHLPGVLSLIVVVVIGLVLTFGLSEKKAESAWYSSAGTWSYRKQITVDHNKVATTSALTNFPMLFSVIDPELKHTSFGGKVASTTGGDLLFTSADGSTLLDYEIEKYASTTGELIVWVEVPSLSGVTDTNLFVYFGNAGAPNNQDPTGVWDSNFVGVWHLGEGDSTASDFYRDSTINVKHGTLTDSNGDVTSVGGKIGSSLKFTGNTDVLTTTENGQYADFTICAWFKDPNTTGSYERIVDKNYVNGAWLARESTNANSWGGGVRESSAPYGRFLIVADGSWNYLCSERRGTTHTVYGNGNESTVTGTVVSTALDTTTLKIGGRDTGSDPSDAYIDEVKVSNVARGFDWIQTEYNNQKNPGSFYSYGSVGVESRTNTSVKQAYKGIGSSTTWYSSSWSYRKHITIDRTKVATTSALTNFPVLISTIDPELKHTSFGGKVASTTGGDLLFTSADGSTLLDYEIEKYASTTGELIVWVEVPSLSGVTDTNLFVYFGNGSAPNNQNPTGVWDSNYKLVTHYKDGSTLTSSDSTTNNHTITNGGFSAVQGKIDGGADSEASESDSQTVTYSSALAPNQITTFSAWVNKESEPTSGNAYIMEIFNDFAPSSIFFRLGCDGTLGNQKRFGIVFYNGSFPGACSGTDISLSTWTYIVATTNGTNANMYLNGVADGTTAFTATPSANTGNYTIGQLGGGGRVFDGIIDELRISYGVARSADWIRTEYNNQLNPSSFYAYGAVGVESRTNTSVKQAYKGSGSSAGWYSSSWSYRKQITIDRTKVATTSSLTNFPLLVSTTNPDLKHTSFGGKVASSTGGDLIFTNADGSTLLDFEIEKYASTTGELVAWVEIPSLSGVTDTTIYMYLGNAAATNLQNPTGVWNSAFVGVWHLGDGDSTSASFYRDSTVNAKHGTLTDSNGDVTAVTGKLGNALKFTGGPDLITTTESGQYTDFTMCAWFKDPNTPVSYERIVDKNYVAGAWLARESTNAHIWGGGVRESGPPYGRFLSITDGNWNYLCSERRGTVHTIYGNGNEATITGTVVSTALDTTTVKIGGRDTGSDPSDAFIDEVKVSNIARGSDWIQTEYNNQKNPSWFMSFGGTQTQTLQTDSGTVAPQMKVRGGVKFK